MTGKCSNCGKMSDRMTNGLCWNCYMLAWYHRNSDRVNSKHRDRNRVVKLEMVQQYGGMCSCCGEKLVDALSLYRPNGSSLSGVYAGVSGVSLYFKLKLLGWPKDGYRLLCLNCCLSTRIFGYCPHDGCSVDIPTGGDSAARKRRYRMRLKLEMIREYGGACSLCGEKHYEFLTIDHINGGGKRHRAEVNAIRGGATFYKVLRDLGWPKDEYRLLCFNCNGVMGNRKPLPV